MAFANASKAVVLGLTVTVTGAFVGVQSAQAASLFDFSYQTAVNKTLSGRISGTRDMMNPNRVTVNSVLSTLIDGTPTGITIDNDIFSFNSRTTQEVTGTGTGALPVISFDATFFDIVACDGATGCKDPRTGEVAEGFVFDTTGVLNFFGRTVPTPLFATGFLEFQGDFNSNTFATMPMAGGNSYIEQFNASNWTLTQIPEPSALLGLATIGLLGFATRKRKK